jgi:hypothetical protein
MTSAISRRLGALVLLACAGVVNAQSASDPQARAAEFATCAAYYFNAVNVKPMQEYEAVYGAGERAFNEGIKLVGRKQLDDLMAHTSGEMMKIMGSDWNNFPAVEQRYGSNCAALMAHVPAE